MENYYLAFEDGQIFHCPAMKKQIHCAKPDALTDSLENTLILPLEEEHTDLGRALVAALWFEHPVKVVVEQWEKQEKYGHAVRRNTYRASVYRCHIVGPVFLEALLEARAKDQERDMVSAWEIHILEEMEPLEVSQARLANRSEFQEYHLDHPFLHT